MKKVLIWDMFPRLNIGGPLGYLYNLHQYLQEHPTEQISFLTDLILEKYGDAEWLHPTGSLTRSPKTFLGKVWRSLAEKYYICIWPFKGIEFQVPHALNVNEFDYVHIHQVTHFQQFKQLFPNYKGKVILTSHSPCPFSDELIERAAGKHSIFRKILMSFRPFLIRMECDAYDKTDFVMFPCPGAREPYEKCAAMREAFERNKNKFFYVPSSIVDYHPNPIFQQKLSDFQIPNNSFVITYFGRHNQIKGYDILVKIGMQLLEKYPNLYFLCAGNGAITPPLHARWKELGFINNVDDLLPQSDLYILPNRETYFDLITLQVLRAGVPIALSNTGGNTYFQELPNEETKGMIIFDINESDVLISIVENMMNMKSSSLKRFDDLKQSNRRLYENYFTYDKYLNNYINFINQLS